ncbi:pPIWI_RE module domain-containing protein [Mastigocoleus testarum]|uniref:DUF3893 domain-containing protein n=1 Tax=Mastigocoleus testarum BC008 TaxID=371196 RepID=A0A0V7ZJR2_9CYAN|nr:DUF3962 domain-containing protein [Mastigocoleus testarum]KST64034.1 hypothetical protein BC008_40270 [Mastigocoleus testarum BC008]KST64744.1 hypothetical protein BC008_41245 [Mastigocoleus testarum BC008]
MTTKTPYTTEINENQVNQILYAQIQRKPLGTIPLVFTIPQSLAPVEIKGSTICWTKEALAEFSLMNSEIKNIKNLPYSSLRSFLEFKLSNVRTIEPSMGLSRYAINQRKQQNFAYIDSGELQQTTKVLKPILHDWLEIYLAYFAQKEGISEDIIERLRELQEQNKLLSIKLFKSQIYPWSQYEESGTARPYRYSFPALADHLARLIAGHEIFQGLGGIKRIISSKVGSSVELITDIISLDDKGSFSLVVEIELITFPSVSQPLIKIDIHKRRWLSSIKEKAFDHNSINGYIFSKHHDYTQSVMPEAYRVFNFKLNRRKNRNTGKWEWQPDDAFSVLQRELNLPLNISNAEQIIQGKASTDDYQVLLTYRNGLQEKKYDIDVGVPEKDKLEAFQAIAKILDSKGIKPFDGYSEVKFGKGKSHPKDITASRTINTPTSFSAILESLENEDVSDFTAKYCDQMGEEEINNLLKTHFEFELSEQGIKKNLRFNSQSKNQRDQIEELKDLIQANQQAIQRLYPKKKPLLIIFHENETRKTTRFLEAVINMLWGDTLEIQLLRLPENTHGPEEALPGSNLKKQERFEERLEAWKSTAKQVAEIKRPKFCLVMARNFYPHPNESSKKAHDDLVNKPATRQALASIGHSCVQFILPPQIWVKSGDIKISEFIIRAQASIKELIWAHSGRIDCVKEKVDKWFSDLDIKDRPQEIIVITVVRKNAGRMRGGIGKTFLPIAIKTNVENGLSQMCYCYEDPKTKNFLTTSWETFTEALFNIAKISPVYIGKNSEERKQRFQNFVDDIISNSVISYPGNSSKNLVVMIDSSNCVQLWDWLKDSKINLSNIDMNCKNYMQDNWRGARIVRIRQDLAPGIIANKVKCLAKTFREDNRNKEELKRNENKRREIPVPSSPTGLYKLDVENKTGCIPYLSIGKKTTTQKQRGVSCYREIELDEVLKDEEVDEDAKKTYVKVKNEAGLEIKFIDKQKPYIGQWATPNPLEIVVTLRQEQDKPDNIAGFVESLRYGYGHFNEWTKLPAPLFFERVVRDYISAFKLEEEEDEN